MFTDKMTLSSDYVTKFELKAANADIVSIGAVRLVIVSVLPKPNALNTPVHTCLGRCANRL